MAGWIRQEVPAPADKSGIDVVSVLALFAAAHVNCFPGAQFTVVFVVLAVLSNLASMVLAGCLVGGRDRSVEPSTTASMLSYGTWAACALGLYATGNVAAAIIAVATSTTSALYAAFNHQTSMQTLVLTMSIPVLALLYAMLHTVWSRFPWQVAIASTVTSFGTVVCIAKAARSASQSRRQLNRAIDASRSARRKMEFVVSSTGEGYFGIGRDPLTFHPADVLRGSDQIRQVRAGRIDATDQALASSSCGSSRA